VPRGTTTARRTDLGGWGKGKLTGATPSMAAKSDGGDSTLAGRRGGGWHWWSGRRAAGHRVRAHGCKAGTGQRLEQVVHVEAPGGGGTEGNRRRWHCTAAIGIGGRVGEVVDAHAGPKEASAGQIEVGFSQLAAVHTTDMASAFLCTTAT
jgi:hypothetical protein